jgi:phage I-like protein
MKHENGEMRALHSAALSGESVPQRVLLAPWGQVESTNGSFVVDEESARLTVSAFDEHGTDLPIDYEHQTLGGAYASPSGQAPAAGWIKRVFAESGVGLLAEIEWTDQAKKRLSAKEYRYLSPVAIIRKTDRKLVAIHSAALTNKPAIVGMQPIVNRQANDELKDETAGASPRTCHRACPRCSDSAEPLAVLRGELQLPAETDAEEVLVAAGERLIELRREAGRRRADERVAEALRAGKLVEAQRAWAEALVAREEELFEEWFRTAPVIVRPGRIFPPAAAHAREHRPPVVAAKARAEYRENRVLAGLTSEEAYVADAMRAA